MTGYSDAEHDKASSKIMADIYAAGGNLPPVMLGPESTRDLDSLTAQGVPEPGRTDAPTLSIYAALGKAQTDAAIRDIKTSFVLSTLRMYVASIEHSMRVWANMRTKTDPTEIGDLVAGWVSDDCAKIRAELEKLR